VKRSLALLVAIVLAVVFACHERPPLRFPHELHLAGLQCGGPGQPACLGCADCHRSAPGSEPAQPVVQQCEPCHHSDAGAEFQASMRPTFEPPPEAHSIHFDHARHLQMDAIKGQCVACHSGAVQQESTLFPPMNQCFSCHEHEAEFERAQCAPCHSQEDVAQLRPVSFQRHDESWSRHHGHDANLRPELCQTCHTQNQCDDCHDVTQSIGVETRMPERAEASFVHRADFITRHALEARAQPNQCLSCHQPETCDGCHAERGVSANLFDARNPHPPGWVGGNPNSVNFHGRAARRDLLSCAGCHDRGPLTNCIDCHRVGGPGGNPHPRGFESFRTRGEGMCRYCHGG
jgi:hypothetical protein